MKSNRFIIFIISAILIFVGFYADDLPNILQPFADITSTSVSSVGLLIMVIGILLPIFATMMYNSDKKSHEEKGTALKVLFFFEIIILLGVHFLGQSLGYGTLI